MPGALTRLGAVLALAAIALVGRPATAAAQTTPAQPLSQAQPPSLTLGDALRLVLERSPALTRARQDVAARDGEHREATGTFDSLLQVGPAITYSTTSLAGATSSASSLSAARSSLSPRARRPVGNLSFSFDRTAVASSTDGVPMTPAPGSPGSVLEFQRTVAEVNGLQIAALGDATEQRSVEAINQVYRFALDAHTRSNLARLLLWETAASQQGATVTSWRIGTASLSFTAGRQLRNGTTLQFNAALSGTQNGATSTSLDQASSSGSSQQNLFQSQFLVLWTQPLRRGQGRVSVTAAERAAARNVEAARYTYQHTAAEQARDTALAYQSLVAAESAVALLQQSLAAQRTLLEMTLRSLAGGDLARSDVVRLQARLAEVETSVVSARADVLAARFALAQVAGLTADETTRLLQRAEAFPEQPPEVDTDALARQTLGARADVKAAGALLETSRVLLEAARANTRGRFDLSAYAGVGTTYYGPLQGVPSRDSFVSYYDPRGVARSFGRRWEPTAQVQFSVELPRRNDALLGQLDEARARVRQSDVHAADLARLVDQGVLQEAESLRRARLEWGRRQQVVADYEATWASTEKRRAAGDMTMFDTLQTERQLTDARLALVQAKQDYLGALVRLAYETGTIVSFPEWSRPVVQLTALLAGRQ